MASMVNLVDQAARDPRVRRIAANPYALDPGAKGAGPTGRTSEGVRFDEDSQRWTGLFVMAAVNTRIVRRSDALLDYAYGRDFRYAEAMSFAPGPKGLLQATAVTAGLTGLMVAIALRPTRGSSRRRSCPRPRGADARAARERLLHVAAVRRGQGRGAQ